MKYYLVEQLNLLNAFRFNEKSYRGFLKTCEKIGIKNLTAKKFKQLINAGAYYKISDDAKNDRTFYNNIYNFLLFVERFETWSEMVKHKIKAKQKQLREKKQNLFSSTEDNQIDNAFSFFLNHYFRHFYLTKNLSAKDISEETKTRTYLRGAFVNFFNTPKYEERGFTNTSIRLEDIKKKILIIYDNIPENLLNLFIALAQSLDKSNDPNFKPAQESEHIENLILEVMAEETKYFENELIELNKANQGLEEDFTEIIFKPIEKESIKKIESTKEQFFPVRAIEIIDRYYANALYTLKEEIDNDKLFNQHYQNNILDIEKLQNDKEFPKSNEANIYIENLKNIKIIRRNIESVQDSKARSEIKTATAALLQSDNYSLSTLKETKEEKNSIEPKKNDSKMEKSEIDILDEERDLFIKSELDAVKSMLILEILNSIQTKQQFGLKINDKETFNKEFIKEFFHYTQDEHQPFKSDNSNIFTNALIDQQAKNLKKLKDNLNRDMVSTAEKDFERLSKLEKERNSLIDTLKISFEDELKNKLSDNKNLKILKSIQNGELIPEKHHYEAIEKKLIAAKKALVEFVDKENLNLNIDLNVHNTLTKEFETALSEVENQIDLIKDDIENNLKLEHKAKIEKAEKADREVNQARSIFNNEFNQIFTSQEIELVYEDFNKKDDFNKKRMRMLNSANANYCFVLEISALQDGYIRSEPLNEILRNIAALPELRLTDNNEDNSKLTAIVKTLVPKILPTDNLVHFKEFFKNEIYKYNFNKEDIEKIDLSEDQVKNIFDYMQTMLKINIDLVSWYKSIITLLAKKDDINILDTIQHLIGVLIPKNNIDMLKELDKKLLNFDSWQSHNTHLLYAAKQLIDTLYGMIHSSLVDDNNQEKIAINPGTFNEVSKFIFSHYPQKIQDLMNENRKLTLSIIPVSELTNLCQRALTIIEIQTNKPAKLTKISSLNKLFSSSSENFSENYLPKLQTTISNLKYLLTDPDEIPSECLKKFKNDFYDASNFIIDTVKKMDNSFMKDDFVKLVSEILTRNGYPNPYRDNPYRSNFP